MSNIYLKDLQNDKVAVEDFAQLAGLSRVTDYEYSMEQKMHLTLNILADHFGMERCELTSNSIGKVFELISSPCQKK